MFPNLVLFSLFPWLAKSLESIYQAPQALAATGKGLRLVGAQMGSAGREHQVPQWVKIHGYLVAQVSQEKHHKQTAWYLLILGLAFSLILSFSHLGGGAVESF